MKAGIIRGTKHHVHRNHPLFYVTDQCELCKQAEQVLVETPIDTPIPVEVVDIAESETLVEQYGERIPVLRMDPQGKELNWPFDQNDVINFLGNH